MGRHFRLTIIVFSLAIFCQIPLARGETKTLRTNASDSQNTSAATGNTGDSTSATPSQAENKKHKEELERLRHQLLIKEVDLNQDQKKLLAQLEKILDRSKNETKPWVVPSSSIQTPVAYGAQWTDVFVAVGAQAPNAYTSKPNGSAYIGFGLGDAQKYVGLEISVGSYGLWPPFAPGGINLKVHHLFPDGWAVALGWNNAIYWGNPDQGVSLYGVVSKYFVLKKDSTKPFSLLTFHLGIGNGEFRSLSDIVNYNNTVNPFFSVGLRIFEPVSFIVNWTGSDIASGFSFAPFRKIPIVAGIGATGFTHPMGEQIRCLFSVAYADSVLANSFPINIFK